MKRAVDMSESIKHAIVLLQIAKNATIPNVGVNSVVVPSNAGEESVDTRKDMSSPIEVVKRKTDGSELPRSNDIVLGIEEGSEVKEDGRTAKVEIPVKLDKTSAIPEISYSSSDDDDFFDAEDATDDAGKSPSLPPASLNLDLVNPPAPVVIQSPLTPSEKDVDFDALYEADDDEDNVDMKSHGSVITHLLSQVRIGMDLTKIVLPTFILERRSLLEMYSDFFAHPDLFCGIAEGRTPEDRMVRVLRWYLSSFHAGRKSSIAKKPYNPILGETFRCHWELDKDKSDGDPKPSDGPLPWCNDQDLTFIAEQVSHHPPISAFYAEHVKKRISVNAHIYTKSSFLGMSVRE